MLVDFWRFSAVLLATGYGFVGNMIHIPTVTFFSTALDCATISSFPQWLHCKSTEIIVRMANTVYSPRSTSAPADSFANRRSRRARTGAWPAPTQSMVPSWQAHLGVNVSTVDLATQCGLSHPLQLSFVSPHALHLGLEASVSDFHAQRQLPRSLQRPLRSPPVVHLGIQAPVVDLATQCLLPHALQRPVCSPWAVQDDVVSPTAYNVPYASPQVVLYYASMWTMAALPTLSVSSKVFLLDAGAVPQVYGLPMLSLKELAFMLVVLVCFLVTLAQLFPSKGQHSTRSASSRSMKRKSGNWKPQPAVVSSTRYPAPSQPVLESDVDEPQSADVRLPAIAVAAYPVRSADATPTQMTKSKKRREQTKRQIAKQVAASLTATLPIIIVDTGADEQHTAPSPVVDAANTPALVLPAVETTGTGPSSSFSQGIEASSVASIDEWFEAAASASDELEPTAKPAVTGVSVPAASSVTTSEVIASVSEPTILEERIPDPSLPVESNPTAEPTTSEYAILEPEAPTEPDVPSVAAHAEELQPAATDTAIPAATPAPVPTPAAADATTSEPVPSPSVPESTTPPEELSPELGLPVETNSTAVSVAHATLESEPRTHGVDNAQCTETQWTQVDRKPRTKPAKVKAKAEKRPRQSKKRPAAKSRLQPTPLVQFAKPVAIEFQKCLIHVPAKSVNFAPPTLGSGENSSLRQEQKFNSKFVVPSTGPWRAPQRADGSTKRWYHKPQHYPYLGEDAAPTMPLEPVQPIEAPDRARFEPAATIIGSPRLADRTLQRPAPPSGRERKLVDERKTVNELAVRAICVVEGVPYEPFTPPKPEKPAKPAGQAGRTTRAA
ncbi:hypothetical protein PsYK624_073740 [Phanerochaete sordida]|uniref:Uncharacterized protein n=1 Tax=Phanerochaete sordida TaxID=48140 RepID=A0A9P3LDG4_9APHY|nr:hypothetical protein PsYK624_073740 [Phanerochaete sordida]